MSDDRDAREGRQLACVGVVVVLVFAVVALTICAFGIDLR